MVFTEKFGHLIATTDFWGSGKQELLPYFKFDQMFGWVKVIVMLTSTAITG